MKKLLKKAARTIVTKIASLKEKSNVLVICGLHNKTLAEYIVLESYRARAYPHLWVFDEKFFLHHVKILPQNTVATLPEHLRALLENSNVVIWLSQFGELYTQFPENLRKAIASFYDEVDETIGRKPCLFINLLHPRCVQARGVNYQLYLKSFIKAVNVDYSKVRILGKAIASELDGKKLIHLYDAKGTDLTFTIEKRPIGVEVGTLADYFSTGQECKVDVPGGEVYVAPIEISANGVLVVDALRAYKIKNLRLCFSEGKIISFKAEKGNKVFEDLLDQAEGDKDRIAEFGVGINHGMKLMGYSIYDEKVIGTAHIAIGNNVHLGGVNKASIHLDFILHSPIIEVDGRLLMKKGKLVCK